jgi:YVTN family beta-propeller protein
MRHLAVPRITAGLAGFLVLGCLTATPPAAASGVAGNPPGFLPSSGASMDGVAGSAPHSTLCPVGTTIDDLIARGLITDPRAPGGGREYNLTDVDPGTAPEGDYMGWAVYTRDGGRILLTNRGTNNVTVFDASTRAVLANIPVGGYPSGIAVTDDYAVVTCPFENRAQIIDLTSYQVVGEAPAGVQPWVIRISPDQTLAYVACDISNTLEVIDLASGTNIRTIHDFPVWLNSWSSNSENGRNSVEFSTFELTPDGQHAVVSNGTDSILFYDLTTGVVDHTVPGVPDGRALALSGDGRQLVVLSITDPVSFRRIDLDTHGVTGTVAVTGYSWGYFCLGVDQTGSKAYTGLSNNVSAFIRFETSTFHIIPETYTAFWIGTSPDHARVVSGQYRFTILDFTTEAIVGQYEGNAQSYGAVSPVASRAVGYDPHRHEGLYFYDFSSGIPVYSGTTDAGLDPEGDCPRRVAIAPDGSKAVVTNVLSDNAVILNLGSLQVEATLPIGDRVQDVAITPDSRWAVICGFVSNSIKVIDLSNNTVAAEVYTGTSPGVVAISPDGTKAYVGNISSNTVSIVALAGAGSHKIADVPAGEIGVVWAAYGVSSGVAASPDNRYALVAASFDDVVRVIDSQTNSVVATVPVGDFPLQLAFDGDGSHAIVTNYFASSYTVLRIDGAASHAVGTFYHGTNPMRLDHDPVLNQTLIGNFTSKTVTITNPETGALIGTRNYSSYGNIVGVIADESGEPVVLASTGSSPPGYLVRSGDAVPLPATPAFFDYSPAGHVAVVASPGPDWISVITFGSTGVRQITNIPLGRPGALLPCRPNPARDHAALGFYLAAEGEAVLDLLDMTGRLVGSIRAGRVGPGRHEVSWAPPSTGAYVARLRLNGREIDARKIVVVK